MAIEQEQPTSTPVENLNIFEMLDYRSFLKLRIQNSSKLSLQAVASRSGCMSKSYLSLVINGKRNLSPEKAALVGRAVGLKGNELKYFESLVRYNRTKEQTAKTHFLKELAILRPRRSLGRTNFEDAEVLRTWHAMVLRELVALPNFSSDPRNISILLRGLLSPSEAKRALSLLLQTKLVVQDGDQFVASEAALQSTDEIRSLAIQQYHKSCLDLGRRVLETQPLRDREFGCVNASISAESFRLIKERLKALREEILHIALKDPAPDRVCQLNFQFFQLTVGGSDG
jgi:uncharacterized protein (TIGR02147 family)